MTMCLYGIKIYNGFQVVESWLILWCVSSLWVSFSLSFTPSNSWKVLRMHHMYTIIDCMSTKIISQFSFQFIVPHVEPVNTPKVTKALYTQTPTTAKGLKIVPHPYSYTYVLWRSQCKKLLSAAVCQNTDRFLSQPWFSWYCCKICYLSSSFEQTSKLTVSSCSRELAVELP